MIIGITGKAMAGKDTFGKMLADSLFDRTGNVYVLMAFAKSLKDRCQRDFDLSHDQLWGDKKEVIDQRYKKDFFSPSSEKDNGFWTTREIMQAYGQFFRTIDYDFWVKELYRIMEDKEYKNVIITDVRHINEAESVKQNNGIVFEIQREVAGSKVNPDHISETALDGYKNIDFYIVNNGPLEDLKEAANDAAGAIIKISKF